MQPRKFATTFTLTREEFERNTGWSDKSITGNMKYATHLCECLTGVLHKTGFVSMNYVRELFGLKPTLNRQTKVYLEEFGKEPVTVEIAENGSGIKVTARNYVDLADPTANIYL